MPTSHINNGIFGSEESPGVGIDHKKIRVLIFLLIKKKI